MSAQIDFKIILYEDDTRNILWLKVIKDCMIVLDTEYPYFYNINNLYCIAAKLVIQKINIIFQFIEKLKNHALIIPKYNFTTLSGVDIQPNEQQLTVTSNSLQICNIDREKIDIIYITSHQEDNVFLYSDTILITLEAKNQDSSIQIEEYEIYKEDYHDGILNEFLELFIIKLFKKINYAYKYMNLLINEDYAPNIQIYMNETLIDYQEIIHRTDCNEIGDEIYFFEPCHFYLESDDDK